MNSSAKPYLIVSDLHLGAVSSATEREFRRFLDHAVETASGLLINGDLFDFWFEYRSVVLREHVRVVAALADAVEAGLPIRFVGGNHDAWCGSVLADDVGLEILEGPAITCLGGRRALVAHGDGLGRGDTTYRLLRRFLRHPLVVSAFRVLHPDWGRRIAHRVSSTEGKAADPDSVNRARSEHLREWAVESLRADPELELVVAGHTHLPEVLEVEPGRFYLNSGDWLHHHSYLSLPADGGAPRLLRWG